MIGLVAKGLLAGLAGTAVMTTLQKIEMRRSGRKPSLMPAKAVEKITGVVPDSEEGERRLASVVHWTYGASWGTVRALLASMGMSGLGATATLFGLLWGTESALLPAMGLSKPVTERPRKQLAKEGLFHAAYAFATSATFRTLGG